METKSTNEVKGDYDRVSASECLGSLIELHGIVMEDDLFVIPDADGTAVLYNDGKIRFDEIATSRSARCLWASCSATAICSTFPVPNRSRRAYTRMAGGVQSLKFLPVALPDISGVNCTGSWATIRRSIDGKQKNRTVVRPIFRVVFSRPLPAVFPFPPLQGEQLPQHVGMVFPHGMPRGHQVGTCEALPALAYRLF